MRDGQRPARDGQRAARIAVPLVVPAKIRVPSPDALPRERLEARLLDAWRHRLTLVVAPAGSGKTTLLARFAAQADRPGGLVPRRDLGRRRGLVRPPPRGRAAVRAARPARRLDEHRGRREGARRAARARGGRSSSTTATRSRGPPPRRALGRLVDYAPEWLAVIVASRVPPVDQPAPPARVAASCWSSGRTTCGSAPGRWSSCSATSTTTRCCRATSRCSPAGPRAGRPGLQLFHLATRGRSADERRRVLSGAEMSGRLLREYLAQNVLFGLPEDLREFLVDTCVLGRLSGPLCDRLRGTTGSGALLDELARRSVFTVPVEDAEDAFRYHEVLRQHLDRMLVEEIGEAEARARHAKAGSVLEADGALPGGAARLLPGGGLGRRPAPPGRTGGAARGDRAERLGRRRAAGHRAPRPVGGPGRRPPGAQRRPLVGGDRRLRPGRGRVRSGAGRRRPAPRAAAHRRVARSGRDADARRDRHAPDRARPRAGAERPRRRAARRRVGAGRARPAAPGGGRGRDRPADARGGCRRGRGRRGRLCGGPARGGGRGPSRRPGLGRAGDGPGGRGGGTGRVTVARAPRAVAGVAARSAVAARADPAATRRPTSRRTPGGRRCSTSPRPGPRPPIPNGASRGPTRPRPGSGAWARACSRRGPAAWRRSRPRASGRRTPATRRWARSRRVARRGRSPRGCTPTRRWRTWTRCVARSTRCSPRRWRPRRGSSCPGRRPPRVRPRRTRLVARRSGSWRRMPGPCPALA